MICTNKIVLKNNHIMEAQNFIIDEEKALEVLEDGTSMDLLNTKVYAAKGSNNIERCY